MLKVKHNAKEYEVRMEIGDYQPEDLTVKLVGDQLSITGEIKHHDAHGSVSTQFSRQFTIPEVTSLFGRRRNLCTVTARIQTV